MTVLLALLAVLLVAAIIVNGYAHYVRLHVRGDAE